MESRVLNNINKKVPKEEEICVTFSFWKIGIVTVSLPLVSLLVCLISAVLTKYDKVTETSCNVTNAMPSVSAVTGVSPERYIWRVCIALHSAPRFIIGFIYLRFYEKCAENVHGSSKKYLHKILRYLAFLFSNIENSALVMVTYISNVENYPIHEKLFVVFMIFSVSFQLVTMALIPLSFPHMKTVHHIARSYKLKVIFLILMIISTSTLLFFFILHRFYCIPGAFTWFSVAEYFIVLFVTAFHFTSVWDFKDCSWSVNFSINILKSENLDQNSENSNSDHYKTN